MNKKKQSSVAASTVLPVWRRGAVNEVDADASR